MDKQADTDDTPYANDNMPLHPDWMTPAGFMRLVRSEMALRQQQFRTDPRTRVDPQKLKEWEELKAMEACGLYRYYRQD